MNIESPHQSPSTPDSGSQQPAQGQELNQEQLRARLDQANRQLESQRSRNDETQRQLSTAGRHNDRLKGMLEATRGQIEQLKEALEADGQAPFTFATVIGYRPKHEPVKGREIEAAASAGCDVLHSGRRLRVSVSPLLNPEELTPGRDVMLNENYTIIAAADPEGTGDIARVKETLPDGRLVVIIRGEEERTVRVSPLVAETPRPGDAVVVDLRIGIALESIELSEVEDVVLEETPDISYADIGGLAEQIEQIRDAVELPFLHTDLYREHGLRAPKGILLYGPPGCGKTMIAKAVASSLSLGAEGRAVASGSPAESVEHQAYFLNIKGPELLNKYVGETERHIRTIFGRARERASDGHPVVVFFDEMEALFRTRGTGVSSDVETTIVPQLLAEIDGVESLENVIVIGASNREDMIDPAILRPGRLDVKIQVQRPSRDGAAQILRLHLGDEVPLRESLIEEHGGRDQAQQALVEQLLVRLYPAHAELMSGAVLANIVDRAKKSAIKEHLAARLTPESKGISAEHLLEAVEAELEEQRAMSLSSGSLR